MPRVLGTKTSRPATNRGASKTVADLSGRPRPYETGTITTMPPKAPKGTRRSRSCTSRRATPFLRCSASPGLTPSRIQTVAPNHILDRKSLAAEGSLLLDAKRGALLEAI